MKLISKVSVSLVNTTMVFWLVKFKDKVLITTHLYGLCVLILQAILVVFKNIAKIELFSHISVRQGFCSHLEKSFVTKLIEMEKKYHLG